MLPESIWVEAIGQVCRHLEIAGLPSLQETPQPRRVIADRLAHLRVVPEIILDNTLAEIARQRSPVAVVRPLQLGILERKPLTRGKQLGALGVPAQTDHTGVGPNLGPPRHRERAGSGSTEIKGVVEQNSYYKREREN